MVNVSVIIPVYNAEKHLKDCIDSLLRQTLPELEFIFVNDGSNDSSAQIIASYQATDSRITLINQPNQGVSVARNNGIALAQGDYIGFVDADDTIEPDFFETLYKIVEHHNAAIVVSNFIQEQGGHRIPVKTTFPTEKLLDKRYINEFLLPTFIKNSSLNTCWNKIYKKRLLDDFTIQFPVGIALGEDGIFNAKAFHKADTVFFVNYSGYFYKEVEGSATRDLTKKDYFKRALEVYNFDYETLLHTNYGVEQIEEWRSIRLVENVLSYVNIYLEPNKTSTWRDGMRYVKKMISHPVIEQSFQKYERLLFKNKSKYQQFLLNCIKNKSVYLLFLAVRYSTLRNK
jgi:glycosyltransferase involved in cell wall biosynthesis